MIEKRLRNYKISRMVDILVLGRESEAILPGCSHLAGQSQYYSAIVQNGLAAVAIVPSFDRPKTGGCLSESLQ